MQRLETWNEFPWYIFQWEVILGGCTVCKLERLFHIRKDKLWTYDECTCFPNFAADGKCSELMQSRPGPKLVWLSWVHSSPPLDSRQDDSREQFGISKWLITISQWDLSPFLWMGFSQTHPGVLLVSVLIRRHRPWKWTGTVRLAQQFYGFQKPNFDLHFSWRNGTCLHCFTFTKNWKIRCRSGSAGMVFKVPCQINHTMLLGVNNWTPRIPWPLHVHLIYLDQYSRSSSTLHRSPHKMIRAALFIFFEWFYSELLRWVNIPLHCECNSWIKGFDQGSRRKTPTVWTSSKYLLPEYLQLSFNGEP